MKKKGFTLVELLAVITILAIILVIAVPKINSYIKNKKKNLFLTSAKNIVRQLSYENIELETIEDSKLSEVGLNGISLSDYDLDSSVVYVIDDDVYIDLVGKGQYEGMYLCGVGISTEGSVQEENCDNSNYGKLILTVDLNGGTSSQVFDSKYEKNSEIILEEPTKTGTSFIGWEVIKGDAEIDGNKLKLKKKNTTIYALYGSAVRLTVDKNGGSSSQTFNENYNTGTVIELLDLKKAGYGFTGWEVTSGNSILSGKTLTIGSSNTTIKGMFTECSPGTYNDGSSVSCIPCENSANVLEWNENAICSIKTCKGGYEVKDNKCVLSDEIWNYPYTGDYQTFTVPRDGYYKLEVWGASGGYTNDTRRGGYGGYSYGEMWLEEGTVLYIYVGGSGGLVPGNTFGGAGYNGGGLSSARDGSAGSGGATHISIQNGLLNTLSDKINDILIVAGGGGAANYNCTGTSAIGGSGGGYIGGTGLAGAGLGGTGGTQTEPGGANDRVVLPTFGHGADDIKTDGHAVPGGGGGFYGGGSNVNACGGGGGSGYIANQNLINKAMYCYDCQESDEIDTKTISTTNVAEHEKEKANKGHGHSTITWIGEPSKNVPVGYQEVEYIENNGTQYIDTELYATNKTGVKVKFNCIARCAVFGARYLASGDTSGSSTKNAFMLLNGTSANNTLYFVNGNKQVATSSNINFGNVYEADILNGIATISGFGNLNATITTTFRTPSTLPLFAYRNNESSIHPGAVRIYYFKMYEDGTLVRDYIPCYRKSDGEIGLYDKVEKKFYTNAGTGVFLKGNDVN